MDVFNAVDLTVRKLVMSSASSLYALSLPFSQLYSHFTYTHVHESVFSKSLKHAGLHNAHGLCYLLFVSDITKEFLI